jgi:peptidoglycan/LPS O-acetylase OafA/YrhL
MQKRVYSLDLLRALAISSVLLFHFDFPRDQLFLRALAHYGWTGVDLFFVLSGFLIGGQLFARMQKHQAFQLGNFYGRRFLRTLPCYFVMLGVYAIYSHHLGQGMQWLPAYFLFLQNFGLPPEFTQSWSLCVEEHFYLLFPLIAFGLRNKGWRVAAAVAGACFLFGLGCRFLIWKASRPDLIYQTNVDHAFAVFLGKIYYPTYNRLDGILSGVLLASIQVYRPETWRALTARAPQFLWAGILLLGLAAAVLFRQMSLLSTLLGFPLLSAGYSCLVLAANGNSWLDRLRIPGVPHLALWSYSIYLTHVLALGGAHVLNQRIGFGGFGLASTGLSLLCVLVGGALLHFLVERPSLALRDRWLATDKAA